MGKRTFKCKDCGTNDVAAMGWTCGECRSKGRSRPQARYNDLQNVKEQRGDTTQLAERATNNTSDGRAAYQQLVRQVGEKKAKRLKQDIMDRAAGKKTRWFQKGKNAHDGGDAK